MAEYIAKDGEERGALMLEAIALLGLMTMMSPMVVRQTADRTAEMEEVAVAGQMKTLRDALSSYIEANYAGIADEAANRRDVSMEQLRPYLPPSFFQGGNVTSKLINDYKVGIRKERPCADAANPDCTNRWKITGMVVSGNANTDGDSLGGVAGELDDRRAARIATMVGADGGYIRSTKTLSALGLGDNDAEKKKVLGAQGIWEGNVGDFVNDAGQGRIVATTTYASGVGGDFLYRHAVSGLPEANSMFTDIDMSGRGPGAHRIRHSGGLEVINGKIVVRRNRVEDFTSTNNEAVHIDQNKIESKDVDVSMEKGNAKFTVNYGSIRANVGSGGALNVDEYSTEMRALEGAIVADRSGLHMDTRWDITQNARDISVDAYRDMYLNSQNAMNLSSSTMDIYGNSGVEISSGAYGLNIAPSRSYGGNGGSTANKIVGGLTIQNDRLLLTNSNNDVMIQQTVGTNTSDIYLYHKDANGVRRTAIDLYGATNSGGMIYTYANGHNKFLLVSNDSNNAGYSFFRMFGPDKWGSRDGLEAGVAGSGGYMQLGHARGGSGDWQTYTIRMNGDSGEIMGNYLYPKRIALKGSTQNAGDFGNVVQNEISVSYSEQGDTTTVNSSLSTAAGSETMSNQLTNTNGSIYKTYGANTVSENIRGKAVSYNKFIVDPAFVSVMNDIKLTSRGGAHLADILPNYINKGIYVLSNTYASGPWPCDSSNCTFNIPRVKKSDGGAIVTGAWESDCTAMDTYLEGDASCTSGTNHLTVSYFASSYKQCPSGQACLTHPYLGAVPAPGRSVNDGTGVMAAFDEGPCPDGYLPVMTVTPTAIEVGKVNHIDMRIDLGGSEADNYVYYNLENIDFINNRASIYQPATSVSTAVQPVNASGAAVETGKEIHGWKVALGTVSTSTSGGYYWNQGGVWQDSMKAVAHTYCYFNPSRFKYPNMVIDNKVMKAMPAPRLWNN